LIDNDQEITFLYLEIFRFSVGCCFLRFSGCFSFFSIPFVELVQKLLVANYTSLLWVFAGKYLIYNFMINSHNSQMLCCKLNVNFHNAQPPAQRRSTQLTTFWRRLYGYCVRKWN